MPKSQFEKLIDAGVQFTEVSRKQAESVVNSLVKSGEVRRQDAEQLVQSLVDRGRETSEMIANSVRRELSKQIQALSAQFSELESNVDALTDQMRSLIGQAERAASPTKKTTAAKKTTAKKSPA